MTSKNGTVERLRAMNPYPEDIFIPLTDEETKKYVKILTNVGFSSDKIHAHWMRFSWNLCCDQLEKILNEMEGEK